VGGEDEGGGILIGGREKGGALFEAFFQALESVLERGEEPLDLSLLMLLVGLLFDPYKTGRARHWGVAMILRHATNRRWKGR